MFVRVHFMGYGSLAGVEGIEPPSFALEANILPLDHTPLAHYSKLFFSFLNVGNVLAAFPTMLFEF